MNRREWSTVPLFLAMLAGSASAAASAESGEAIKVDCGVNALYLLARLEGRPIALDRLDAELPARHPDGFSMAELIDIADRLGLGLEGIRWNNRDASLAWPAIAYLRVPGGGHFVALRPVGSTGACVQVIDPPYSPRVIDLSRLVTSPQWTGNLLVAREAWPVRHRGSLVGSLLVVIGCGAAAWLGSIRRRRRSSAVRDARR